MQSVHIPVSAQLDNLSTAQGAVLYRGASGWVALAPGTSGQVLQTQGAAANPIWTSVSGAGLGDVSGPASATNLAVAIFDGTSGKNLKNSGVLIDASNNVSGVARLDATRLFLNTSTPLSNEYDSLYIVTPTITDSIGRGINVVTTFAGAYGATGINSYFHTSGATNPNHVHSIQSHLFHEGTFTLSQGAAYWGYLDNSAATGAWSNGYVFLSQGVAGTIANAWAFFARGTMPSYFGGRVFLGASEITNASLAGAVYGRFNVAHTHATVGGGLSAPNATFYSTNTAAVGVGGSIALGGESGAGTTPYGFAYLLGAKEQAGATYNGYLAIYTTDTGSNNSEKARVTSTGNLLVGTTSESGLTGGGGLRIAGQAMFAGAIGFHGSAPLAKPELTGSRGSNAAVASIATALANYGLVTDSTTP